MADELADLLGLHGDEVLLAALLLEDDGRHSAGLALLGCHVTHGGGLRHGENHLARGVLQRWGREVDAVVDHGGGGEGLGSPEKHGSRLGKRRTGGGGVRPQRIGPSW